MRNDGNKEELLRSLSHVVVDGLKGKEIYATIGDSVLTYQPYADIKYLSPCTQEEADTRVLLHVLDAVKKGIKRILIRTVDTDIVVLAIAHYFTYHSHGVEKLWIAIGTGKSYRYLAIHKIAAGLGHRKSESLTLYHAFTGCDTVSFFAQIGKKNAWKAWEAYTSITQTFHALTYRPSLETITMEIRGIERFVAILYYRTTEIKTVNKCSDTCLRRKQEQLIIFLQQQTPLNNI